MNATPDQISVNPQEWRSFQLFKSDSCVILPEHLKIPTFNMLHWDFSVVRIILDCHNLIILPCYAKYIKYLSYISFILGIGISHVPLSVVYYPKIQVYLRRLRYYNREIHEQPDSFHWQQLLQKHDEKKRGNRGYRFDVWRAKLPMLFLSLFQNFRYHKVSLQTLNFIISNVNVKSFSRHSIQYNDLKCASDNLDYESTSPHIINLVKRRASNYAWNSDVGHVVHSFVNMAMQSHYLFHNTLYCFVMSRKRAVTFI